MCALEDFWDGSRWRAVVQATLLFGGSVVAAAGFVAAAASLVAGFGLGTADSLKVAAVLGGGLLLVGFLVPFARVSSRGLARGLAGIGTTTGFAGLALFWLSLPAGWTGTLDRLPLVALGTYVTGLVVVFGAGLAESATTGDDASAVSETGGGSTDALGGIESVSGTDTEPSSRDRSVVSSSEDDGGEDADGR